MFVTPLDVGNFMSMGTYTEIFLSMGYEKQFYKRRLIRMDSKNPQQGNIRVEKPW